MGLIADVLTMLKPPVPVEDAPPPALPTVADLRAALDRMTAERVDAETLIAEAPFRRTELLRAEGTDKAIHALEAAVDRAHLQVERLDALRPELLARIRGMEAENRSSGWLDFRSRLVEQLEVCGAAQHAADVQIGQLHALVLECWNAGYRPESAAVPLHCHNVPAGCFSDIAASVANQRPATEREVAPTWNVRFFAFCTVVQNPRVGPTAFLAGQEAGFDAATARRLIEQGKAELADPKPLPPAPPKQIGPRRTQVEQQRFEDAVLGGVRVSSLSGELPPEHPTRTWTPVARIEGGI